MLSQIQRILIEYPFWMGLTLRLVLAWFLPWCLDDGRWIPGVPYTDIDYNVFTDAAHYVSTGGSPYDRHTYRYTPFLAALLSRLPHREAGRHLFCLADAICGWLIIQLRRSSPSSAVQDARITQHAKLIDGLWWMYNPLAINICTRGSAESFMVLLPVLLTVQLVTSTNLNVYLRATLAGIMHGIAIHSKLYPLIYTLSYMAYFAIRCQPTRRVAHKPSISSLFFQWILRLLHPVPILFGICTVTTFGLLTCLAFYWYGLTALDEGLLYHLSRVDHRHNYSIFWYPIYLGLAQAATDGFSSSALVTGGPLLLVPQAVLLCFSSLGIAPHDLGLALFCQTFLFVTLNKVITAQYFTWYLCLLPLCRGFQYNSPRVKRALLYLGLSIVVWLASAYCLEMQGLSVHRWVWGASIVYFAANVNLLGALLQSYTSGRSKQD